MLRSSQSIQTEFKNAVKSKMKKQLHIAKPNATDEELESLARDPEAA